MHELSEADRFLLEAVQRGDEVGWTQLVQRYQGRLLAFARRQLRDHTTAEDLVQDTFMEFLRSLSKFRRESSLETFLFAILRYRLLDHYRKCKSELPIAEHWRLEDTRAAAAIDQDTSASWYARKDEANDIYRRVLAVVLGEMVRRCQTRHLFEDLMIVELLFVAQLRNRDVAQQLNTTENHVGLTKHRWLKRLQQGVAAALEKTGEAAMPQDFMPADTMLSNVWQQQRLSCPKRSTVGAHMLGTLDRPWHDYVTFHLETRACEICCANLDDLKQQAHRPSDATLRNRILQSTIGFFNAPH